MATKRRPVITVVEARPMAEVNFRGFNNNNINNNNKKNNAKILLNDLGGISSSRIISNIPETASSTSTKKTCNSNDEINSKKDNAVKPPIPASRKFLKNASNEMSAGNNEHILKANKMNYSSIDERSGKRVVTKISHESMNEIAAAETEIDLSLESKVMSQFGGNWFDDKKEFGIPDPGVKTGNKTIIRPRSTFIDKTFLPDCKSNISNAKTNDNNQNLCRDSEHTVKTRKPSIIKPKPSSKTPINFNENIDRNQSETDFNIINVSDVEQLNQTNIDPVYNIKDDFKFTKDSDYKDLMGLNLNLGFVKNDCEQDILKTLNETRPLRPAVGPKLKISFEISSCSCDGPKALALFDYQSGYADDLNFKAGEIILLDDSIDEKWLKGHKHMSNEFGMFPKDFVQILQTFPSNNPDMLASNFDYISKCVARFDFEGIHANRELSFNQGDMIFVSKKVNSEWFEGRHGTSNEKGFFPSSFVEVIQDEVCQGHEEKPEGTLKKVTALYDFNGGQDGDLEFKAGETINVFNQISSEWMEGKIGERSGIFPASFVADQ